MITRQFRPILTPPLRLSFRPNSSTASSLADDLRDRILVYRNSLRKVDTSPNQFCASLDKACASGKLLLARLAGTCGGCGQSTAGGGGLLAHPLKVSRQVASMSERDVTLLPCRSELGVCKGFTLTILLLQRACPRRVIFPKRRDLGVGLRGRVPTSCSKGDERSERRRRRLEPSTHSSHPLTGLTYTVYCAVLSREPLSFQPRLMRTQQG